MWVILPQLSVAKLVTLLKPTLDFSIARVPYSVYYL